MTELIRVLRVALMYPDGLDVPGDLHQFRDLIRVYSMGWCDALMKANDVVGVREFVEEFKMLADPNWWPDASWRWW